MWSVIEAVHGTNPKEEVKSLPRGELRGEARRERVRRRYSAR